MGLFLWRSSSKIAQIIPELKIEKTSNNISVTTGRISTKLDRLVPWEVFYQNCSNYSALLHKMATRTKNRNFKRQISVTTGQISIKHHRIVPWELYQNCSNRSAALHKMAARAKNRKITSNDISVTTGWITTKLVSWKILYQNCSNQSFLLCQMATRAKNRINFK